MTLPGYVPLLSENDSSAHHVAGTANEPDLRLRTPDPEDEEASTLTLRGHTEFSSIVMRFPRRFMNMYMI
jgi:hypothetical protein